MQSQEPRSPTYLGTQDKEAVATCILPFLTPVLRLELFFGADRTPSPLQVLAGWRLLRRARALPWLTAGSVLTSLADFPIHAVLVPEVPPGRQRNSTRGFEVERLGFWRGLAYIGRCMALVLFSESSLLELPLLQSGCITIQKCK